MTEKARRKLDDILSWKGELCSSTHARGPDPMQALPKVRPHPLPVDVVIRLDDTDSLEEKAVHLDAESLLEVTACVRKEANQVSRPRGVSLP